MDINTSFSNHKKLHSHLLASSFFFVGPMGAGKTTIGSQLAQKLDCTFYDSDHFIIETTGVSIPLIFEYEGEIGFRKREIEAIDYLTNQDNIVLSTGGGAVLREENRKHLSERGTIIYLDISPEQQYERIKHDQNRPLIQQENPLEVLRNLRSARHPLYMEIANYVVNCDGRDLKTIVEGILHQIVLRDTIKNCPWIYKNNENINR